MGDPKAGKGETFEPEPQTKTNEITDDSSTENTTPTPQSNGNVTLTQEQFDALIRRLDAGTQVDKAASPSFTPGVGIQLNPFGQVVGTTTKFNVDPAYYPDPREELLKYCDKNPRMRRHNVRENYVLTWDITAKPYETKDHTMIQEPTFHITLYGNEFDDEGEPTDRAYVVQTLHLNEDETEARLFAAEEGVEVSDETMKNLMDRTRFERIRKWLVEGIFYPPRNFELNVDSKEEAIGGTVVKVVTKSNVKGFGNPTPKIQDEELS